MHVFVFTLALVVAYFGVSESCDYAVDYYWRNYKGVLLADAIQGGRNQRGNSTYIGQVAHYHEAGIRPANLHLGDPNAVAVSHGGHYSFSTYVTILCSKKKDEFVWLPTTIDTAQELAGNYHLVSGGVEEDSVLYIGRAYQNNELQIGKVYLEDRFFPRGLWLYDSYNGPIVHHDRYEILAYPLNKI